MSGEFECDNRADELQAKYDRLIAHRARLIKYYDDAPDGDIRKYNAEKQLVELGARIARVERQFDELF